jgi:hypothetical protein
VALLFRFEVDSTSSITPVHFTAFSLHAFPIVDHTEWYMRQRAKTLSSSFITCLHVGVDLVGLTLRQIEILNGSFPSVSC